VPGTVVVGTQWGDEGKGKLTDILAAEADMVVRFHGGHNAGHTIVAGEQTFAVRLVPSGSLHPHVKNVIGNGVVVDPAIFLGEIDMLRIRSKYVGIENPAAVCFASGCGSFNIDNLRVESVPEPEMLGLLLLGGFAAYVSRRRHAKTGPAPR